MDNLLIKSILEQGTDHERIEWRLPSGALHRENGPAVEWKNGTTTWYQRGKLHREDGPAIEKSDGYKAWCKNGALHREDGPAVIQADGSKQWCLHGERYTEEEFEQVLNSKNNNSPKLKM